MQRFNFLEERFPELADYGRKAEESFNDDKNICLLNLGRIAEHITKILCSQNNIKAQSSDELLERKVIDETIDRKIKTLIEVKDDAVDDEYESEMSCERLLLTAEELCRWFMSERGESRFSFLADLFPDSNPIPPLSDLALYGREAEENLFQNTRYSLICLGDIEESIVERIMNLEDIESNSHDEDQADRINLLYHKDIISKENKDILHELRIARNKAAHSRYNSIDEAQRLIDEALSVCEWVFRFMISSGSFIKGTISRVNEDSLEVHAGRIQCMVEGEDIPESSESLSERYREGERRIFKVIDSGDETIRLSIKGVYTDPWVNIARRYEKYEVGQILNVKVMSFSEDSGAVVEIVGPLEITEGRIPDTEYGKDKPRLGETVKARIKWFDTKTYPYMILSAKDVPDENKSFIAMCADSSPEEIRSRITDSVDVNAKNHNGMTALMNAAMHNDDPEVIRVLLESGAKVNSVNMNSSGNTALIFAAMYNNSDVVNALIDNEADITVTNTESKTAYDYALNNEKLKDSEVISRLMIEIPKSKDEEFIELCRTGSAEEIRNALNKGANIEARNNAGDTVLMIASVFNSAEAVSELLEAGADVNAQNDNGTTALMSSLYNSIDPENVIKTLLSRKPDISLKNVRHKTALEIAEEKMTLSGSKVLMILLRAEFLRLCRSGNEEELTQIINAGVNVNTRNKSQATGLMFAAQYNTSGIVELLIDSGADVDAQDIHGNTALIYASSYNTDDVLDVLINKGAEVNIMNHVGQKALKFARKNYRLFDTVAINVLEELTRD